MVYDITEEKADLSIQKLLLFFSFSRLFLHNSEEIAFALFILRNPQLSTSKIVGPRIAR
jgi:hypothetical protein